MLKTKLRCARSPLINLVGREEYESDCSCESKRRCGENRDFLRIKEAARLSSLFAMTEPYPPIGETIRCEATVRGISSTSGLTLEFWANSPSGEFEKIGTLETKSLSPTETATYSAEFEPDEEGLYNIYAYLFDNGSRIGRKPEVVYVKDA